MNTFWRALMLLYKLPPGALSITPVQPGDVIVYQTKQTLTHEAQENIRDACEFLFPNHRVVVLTNGDTIRLWREQERTGSIREQD